MRGVVAGLAVVAGCGRTLVLPDAVGKTGDWPAGSTLDPVVEYRSARGQIWALSDPHGGIEALKALLQVGGLVDTSSAWSGGDATLVVVGDLIDKGDHSIEVIDLVRGLQTQAASAGGRVVVTMGNHEAEFFADPENAKATSTGTGTDGIDNELASMSITPAALADGEDLQGRGAWLRALPIAARIDNYFFAHAGNTQGDSIEQLRARLVVALATGFAHQDLTGDSSILEARDWYGDQNKDSTGLDYAGALGVAHIVFGHDPNAFGEQDHIAVSNNHALIKIDCAMGLAGNPGQLLHISGDTAEKIKLSGERDVLY
jgi:hypothetical protein